MTERSTEASSSPAGPQGDAQARPGPSETPQSSAPQGPVPPPGRPPAESSNGSPAASGVGSRPAGSPPPPKQAPPSQPPPARPPSPEAGTSSESAPSSPSGSAPDSGRTDGDRGSDTTGPHVDDTAVRPPLTTRIQAKLTEARAEVKAKNAAKEPDEGKDPERTAPRASVSTTRSTTTTSAAARGPRRARLRLTRIDPWSVMKTAFLLSIAFGIVTVVAVAMIWTVLDQAGVWSSVNSTIQEGIGGNETANFDVENYVGTSRVLGFTMLVAAVDVVLLTAIATLAAFLYNMAAALLGGVEVTLAEDKH